MDLFSAYDDENLFARMLAGREQCFKVLEDAAVLAFLDVYLQQPGHTVVIPKRRGASNFLDRPDQDVGPYMDSVQRVARRLVGCLNSDGLALKQYNGAAAGQTVFRLHFHLIPHHEGQIALAHGKAPRADDATPELLARRLQDCAPKQEALGL